MSSGALLADSDPSPGKAKFRLCRPSLVAGKYKIRMKITYKDGYDNYEGYVKPSYFPPPASPVANLTPPRMRRKTRAHVAF